MTNDIGDQHGCEVALPGRAMHPTNTLLPSAAEAIVEREEPRPVNSTEHSRRITRKLR